MGAHVIVASRNRNKCVDTIKSIQEEFTSSEGSLEIGVLDTSDFDSVHKFVEEFKSSHSQLHFLVNNAGIHYFSGPLISPTAGNFTSKQGIR
jgi:NAD(P)-dependent dehydrogenase (short-subunit alcohol dehydrogenase family)